MYICPIKNTAFKGYRDDIKTAESVIRDINSMGLKSSSHIVRRYMERKDSFESNNKPEKNKSLMEYLSFRFRVLQSNIAAMREKTQNSSMSKEAYIKHLMYVVKRSKVANCEEMTAIAQELFAKKDIKTDQIALFILDKETNKLRQHTGVNSHAFLLMNHSKDAIYSDPKTWGDEAIIVDPWLGISRSAHTGIKQVLEWIKHSPEKEIVCFRKKNFEDADVFYQELRSYQD